MAFQLVKWNTGRKIYDNIRELAFFKGYHSIHPELTEIYNHLYTYMNNNYKHINRNVYGYDEEGYEDWITYLDNVTKFQRYVRNHEDDASDEISKRAVELFGNKNVVGAVGMEIKEIDRLNLLLDYAENVRYLFNYLVPLTNPDSQTLMPQTEQEIRAVLDSKGLGKFQVPDELLVNN
jgi:hypothetical protein